MPLWKCFPVNIQLGPTSQVITSESGCITYWNWRDFSSTGSNWKLIDGNSSDGTTILEATTLANESFRDFAPRHSLCFELGLYYFFNDGEARGSIALLLGHNCSKGMVENVQVPR